MGHPEPPMRRGAGTGDAAKGGHDSETGVWQSTRPPPAWEPHAQGAPLPNQSSPFQL